VWLRNVVKCGKYSLVNSQILDTFVLRAELLHIWAENGRNFRTQYKSIQNLHTLQGYIFRILQHFATNLCIFTHFSMLFLAVVIYLHLLA
jgi:hypothetical protein